jgi:hypothetical protein
MGEYAESVKALQISIRRFLDSGIPIVIKEFDPEAYDVIKGTLPFYLNLPHENYVPQNVGRGYSYLTRFAVWMQKRVPMHVLAQRYMDVLSNGLQRGLAKDAADADRIANEFEREHLRPEGES